MDNSIFQSKEWEELKLKTGYQKSYRIEDILVLQKNLPLGRSMIYSPMVPEGQVQSIKLSSYKEEIEKIAKENNSIFYRLELDIPKELSTFDFRLSTRSFVKSFEQMQPEHTWVLDITKDEETLLAEMSMRCRYNVRLAEKSGVKVSSSLGLDEEKLNNFYKLYSITGKRHGISFRSQAYFASLLEILGRSDKAYVYNATLDKDNEKNTLSAGILIYSREKAIYIFGASSNEHRNLKAPNLLVWQMIQDAKKHGASEFDFYGIAPDDDPKHPWAGITSFKKQFGGRQVDIVGSYDLVFKPLEYKAFKVAEKMRRK